MGVGASVGGDFSGHVICARGEDTRCCALSPLVELGTGEGDGKKGLILIRPQNTPGTICFLPFRILRTLAGSL